MVRRSAAERGGWAMARLARGLRVRLADGWRSLPPGAVRRWLRVILPGFVLTAAFSAGLTLAARSAFGDGPGEWETALLRRLDASGLSFNSAIWMETPGNGVFLLPVAAFAAGFAAWRKRPLVAFALLGGFGLLDLFVVGGGWLLWARDRPDVIAAGLSHPGGIFHAFPSGHTAQTLYVFGLLAWLWARASGARAEKALAALLALLVTTAVALARMRLGAHWPTDVIGGALIAAAWLAVNVLALRRAES